MTVDDLIKDASLTRKEVELSRDSGSDSHLLGRVTSDVDSNEFRWAFILNLQSGPSLWRSLGKKRRATILASIGAALIEEGIRTLEEECDE